jgi:ribosomal protein L37AE/L43A
MIVFCPTCGEEVARSEASGAFDCERCGDTIEHPEAIPTFGDIARALDEIEKKLANLSQAIKF